MTTNAVVSPYINTTLETVVRLPPAHMDNDLRKHIKDMVEKKFTNKTFLDYGYITKIHEVQINDNAMVLPEDPMSCGMYKVKFLCTLCRPLTGSYMICRIKAITPEVILLTNGPINVIIQPSTDMNKDIFSYNQKINSWVAKISESDKEKKYIALKDGLFVKVKVTNKNIRDSSQTILCLSYMDNIATESEIKQSEMHSQTNASYVQIDEYMDLDNKLKEKGELEKLNNINSALSETPEDDEFTEED